MNKDIKVYLVGGAIRDELMGLKVHDRDYCVIAPSYDVMKEYLVNDMGIKIHVEKPEFVTIRGKHNELGDVDFVLGRKDGNYSDGRRPDSVSVAETIEEDLARRDATINAMAREVGSDVIIDPFGGQQSIKQREIKAVGNPRQRIQEDYLRILRYFRLAITKNFNLEMGLFTVMKDRQLVEGLKSVSTERIRDEMFKAFKHSTDDALIELESFPCLRYFIFTRTKLWLRPTLEQK